MEIFVISNILGVLLCKDLQDLMDGLYYLFLFYLVSLTLNSKYIYQQLSFYPGIKSLKINLSSM